MFETKHWLAQVAMTTFAIVLAGASVVYGQSMAAKDDPDLFPFVLPWDDASPGPTDLSGWLHKPAGRFGHVRGEEGHLYIGEDDTRERIRFLGVNVCFAGCFPEKAQAEKIAARMAKFGINCVRFHHMDMQTFPRGIRDPKAEDTRTLSPEALDRLDYFIAQLKRRGIYVNLNLLVSRPFNAADGLPEAIEDIDWKDRHVVGFFDDRMIELQKEYARKLLTHRNPYTKLTYAEDPCVAFVEINNENGLLHGHLGGKLDRMPKVFRDALQAEWNAWLAARHKDAAAMRKAWGARRQPLQASVLTNGDFEKSAVAWSLEQHQDARAEVSRVPKADGTHAAARIEITNPGEAGWHVQFNQPGLNVQKGALYTVRFRARADAARRITVNVGQAHHPWGGLGLSRDVNLTDKWQDFELVFEASETDANARLNFTEMATRRGGIELSQIRFQPGGYIGPDPTWDAGKGTVPLPPRNARGMFTREGAAEWIEFLWLTERDYWRTMYRCIKDDLKCRALTFGTIVACSTPILQAEMDVIDTHAYWQHPRFPGRPWDRANWTVENRSMVNEKGGVLPRLAMQRVEGKPHLVTEYNHSAPNTYGSEAPLLLAAFAALQDWDGIFLFAYNHSGQWDQRKINSFFDIDQHPTKMVNMIAAHAMFVRGDVEPLQHVRRTHTWPQREREIILSKGHAWGLADGSKYADPIATLTHRTAMKLYPHAAHIRVDLDSDLRETVDAQRGLYRSGSGHFKWDLTDRDRGVVSINTPQTCMAVGHTEGRGFDFGGTLVTGGDTRQDWSTIAIVATEIDREKGISRGLIIATGYAENTDMGWKGEARKTVGADWGKAPSLVEGVAAGFSVSTEAVKEVNVWALDERGRRRQRVPVEKGTADGNLQLQFTIGPEYRTLWYEIEAKLK